MHAHRRGSLPSERCLFRWGAWRWRLTATLSASILFLSRSSRNRSSACFALAQARKPNQFHICYIPYADVLLGRAAWMQQELRPSSLDGPVLPPSPVPSPDGCLSITLVGEATAASVNKCLIFPLLVPVCLSVWLTCQQLSRRSGVAVSHMLVSLLLSVHLPVRDS